ncbi:MAG: MAPEG family protein [Alphaproteobacteria bacterium]|jgi:uncharacterized MAPEG superfamily protein|nr:MAPEG family protein [Alphaproteobacteria bacterium]MBT4082986.1 MAPEG family protein [Alphaproteobacteria bacterium]MBT4543457.1 MAPEG family protein [Alphaproteobacteria bacterium]MBT7745649.1 MAPEG family protein [Alphaproteobacteria bacterium]
MTVDLTYLAWSAALCIVMWMPHVTARALKWGPAVAAGYPDDPPPVAKWITLAARAHANMVENMGAFTALVLVAHVGGMANETTALGAMLFFWAKLVHAIVHSLGIPWIRTLAFFVAWIGMVMIFLRIIGWM